MNAETALVMMLAGMTWFAYVELQSKVPHLILVKTKTKTKTKNKQDIC